MSRLLFASAMLFFSISLLSGCATSSYFTQEEVDNLEYISKKCSVLGGCVTMPKSLLQKLLDKAREVISEGDMEHS